jgi:hypothetical protein
MEKIWIIKGSRYTKKFRIYKKESDLLKAISQDSSLEILEYDLKSSVKSSDYIKQKERDTQLRSVLGELSKDEESIENFINLFEELAPNGKEYERRIWESSSVKQIKTNTKKEMLKKLRKLQGDRNSIVKIIKDNKNYFFKEVSNNVDWYLSILKIHNFRDHIYDSKKWDSKLKFYVLEDTASDVIKNNFKEAKLKFKNTKIN